MDRKLVTLWFRLESYLAYNDGFDTFEDYIHNGFKEEWVFNHLEEHVVPLEQQKPLPIKSEFKEQVKFWKHGIWAKQTAVLTNGKIIFKFPDFVSINDNGEILFIEKGITI